MPLILNGTTGISGVDGSAGTPSYQGGDNNTGIFYPAADTIAFAEGGTEVMRIDSSGNVGIGTSSPSSRLHVKGTDVKLLLETSSGATSYIQQLSASPYNVSFYNQNAGSLIFGTNDTERMRITSGGDVGIGTSSPTDTNGWSRCLDIRGTSTSNFGGTYFGNSDATVRGYIGAGGASGSGYAFLGTATNHYVALFTNNSERMRITSGGELLVGTTSAGANTKFTVNGNGYFAGTSGTGGRYIGFSNGTTSVDCYVGNYQSIMGSGSSEYALIYSTNRVYAIANTNGVYVATNGTSWTSASDERLKDIIEPINDASNKVCSLRAVIGKYKTDKEGVRRSFLIAQDVQAVLPEAVDASNPDELGVQYTDVIPLLVAAIKEQQAMIEELKQEVAALKASH